MDDELMDAAAEAGAEAIDGGTVEGNVAVSHRRTGSGSRISAGLKAAQLDLEVVEIAFGHSRKL